MATVTVSFTYNPANYPLLHEWLEGMQNREQSSCIRNKLEEALKQSDNSLLEQILEEIRTIRDNGHIRSYTSTSTEHKPDTTPATVAPDILDNLRTLGK